MIKNQSVLVNSDSGYKITLNQQNQDIKHIFSQFKEDFNNIQTLPSSQNHHFLSTTSITQRKPIKDKSKDKKRMKLIDYIYIKNTAKKNQKLSKNEQPGMSANELRKSRMKEGKQKAFRAIVDEMCSELKQLSAKAATMAEYASQNINYTGNTDEIAKLCNIRRVLKDNILKSMGEIQKLMGIENNILESKSRAKINQEQQAQLDDRLKRLQALGVQKLASEQQAPPIISYRLTVNNKLSNKDTCVSSRQSYRQDP